jgi:rhodanese-related sulfurtransferase
MPIKKAWDAVAEAKKDLENLSIDELKAEMAADSDLLLVDIREVQERVDKGAIAGSVHVPRGMLEFWADPSIDYYREFFRPERRTVLYCAGGGRSALAAKALKEMGYENVAHLEAGFDGWAKSEAVEETASTSKWVRRA